MNQYSGFTGRRFDTVDLRLATEATRDLYAKVDGQEKIGYDARSGALFVFYSRRRDALKILFFDGSGMCQVHKRLDRGTFRLPEPGAEGARHVEIDDATLEALLDGIAVDTPPERPKRSSVH